MVEYRLSNKADADLDGIYTYSYLEFGEARADAYFLGLKDRLESLAESPRLGRAVDHIHPVLYRYDHASHAIFYTITEYGIFIARVLHQSMDAKRNL